MENQQKTYELKGQCPSCNGNSATYLGYCLEEQRVNARTVEFIRVNKFLCKDCEKQFKRGEHFYYKEEFSDLVIVLLVLFPVVTLILLSMWYAL